MAARLVALVAAIGLVAVGIARGTWAVGGSDSSCYALMAEAFAHGKLQPTTRLAGDAPWPDAQRTFAPGGFIPSPVRRDAASPICAPGFSLLLAPLRAIGGPDAIFLLTPIAGALLVWGTFLLARHLGGPLAGAGAALVVATMPVLLFQVVQPMNDVTVGALWTLAIVMAARWPARVLALGAVTGLAVLVRPNLAPLVAPVVLWVVWTSPHRVRAAGLFALGVTPFVTMVMFLNQQLYGHPLASGYGAGADLFSVSHVVPNARHYVRTLFTTQLGFPLVALAAPFVVPAAHRPIAWLILALGAAIDGIYLLYTPFDEWWYLRFFLPVLPSVTALSVVVIARPWGARGVVPVVGAMVAFALTTPATVQALDLWKLEQRFRLAGRVMREQLPPTTAFVTVWESGSARYHAEREALLWDSLDPAWLDRALTWLSARGLHPVIVVEEWEEPRFRQRFAAQSEYGGLDWPPRFDIDRQVRIFDPEDRARYLAGDTLHTEIVWPNRR